MCVCLRPGTGGDICLARSDQTKLGQLATAEGEVHHLSPPGHLEVGGNVTEQKANMQSSGSNPETLVLELSVSTKVIIANKDF